MPEYPTEVPTSGGGGGPYWQSVELLKRMDPNAWDSVLKTYSPDLRRDIRISLTKCELSAELTDDIEQETWLTAVRKFGEFVWEDEDKFYHWLRCISLNHIRTYRHRDKKSVSLDDFQETDTDGEPERFLDMYALSAENVEDRVVTNEQLRALDGAMGELKPRDREILMRWLLGETPRELARAYDMPPRTISTIVQRTKDKVEVYLDLGKMKDRWND